MHIAMARVFLTKKNTKKSREKTSCVSVSSRYIRPIGMPITCIWGCKNFSFINAIHNRACRFFLGVGKYTPNAAVAGDMGWIPIFQKQWQCLIRLWCRLNNMSSDRLNRKIFIWADIMSKKHKCIKNWNFYVRKTFSEYNAEHLCIITDYVDSTSVVNTVMSKMFSKYVEQWQGNLQSEKALSGKGGNKLRTYNLFKNSFETETYCKIPMPFSQRSSFAKFRCGVAPLRIETGRFEKLILKDRVCDNCMNILEDEAHVILSCPLYDDFRKKIFDEATHFNSDFMSFDDKQKLVFLFTDNNMIRSCAKACNLILNRRRNVLYCK